MKPEFCDISEEEDVQARRIVVMEPGASVVCTAEEEKIFTTLLDVVKRYDLPVTLRVAGGWVRDKLLGKHSSDIDIALDTMMGEEFAGKVNEYLKEKGEETHGVGVIQSNPDQSKHLETATMRVHGTWLDLVNLRSEEYTEASRIPEMKFGSATDDAFRRDLTINSLFYNINLRCVEDFTGMGLEDLQAGIIRTPLPPRTTFLDDPLRILRSVRFASRFGFSLDDAIVHAATDAEVQEKLRAKVSRERVGKEVQGMLRGPSPGDALSLLCRFNLFDTVFATSFPDDAHEQAAEHGGVGVPPQHEVARRGVSLRWPTRAGALRSSPRSSRARSASGSCSARSSRHWKVASSRRSATPRVRRPSLSPWFTPS